MACPETSFVVASPAGDIPVTPEKLSLPLEGCTPVTSYEKYFQDIVSMLSRDNFHLLTSLVPENRCSLDLDRTSIVIRAQKHGAFYHPASVDIRGPDSEEAFTFGTILAYSPLGRETLRRDHLFLDLLGRKVHHPYLPEVFALHEDRDFSCLVEEWFLDFHEFHVTSHKGFVIWDYPAGNRLMDKGMLPDVYGQVARILTTYYDPVTFCRIHPWHHAAGDFVLSTSTGRPRLKLTTVRNYSPMEELVDADSIPLLALLYFFLELALQIRIDRLEGTGPLTWLDREILAAGVEGFRQALSEYPAGPGLFTDFLDVITAMDRDELAMACNPLLGYFPDEEQSLITAMLDSHLEDLAALLQKYKA